MKWITTKYDYYIDIIKHLLQRQSANNTVVIVCSSKQDFAKQLMLSFDHETAKTSEIPASQQSEVSLECFPSTSQAPWNNILSATLHNIASSQAVKLIYCSNTSILRAYLASFNYSSDSISNHNSVEVIILDLLALHHGTSEFSLQGLSKTFAIVASLSVPSVQLIECKDPRDPESPHRGSELWQTQVPLLTGSVKIGAEGSRWASRSITARKVASRWFVYEEKERTEITDNKKAEGAS